MLQKFRLKIEKDLQSIIVRNPGNELVTLRKQRSNFITLDHTAGGNPLQKSREMAEKLPLIRDRCVPSEKAFS